MKRIVLFFWFLSISIFLSGAKVDTLNVYSKSMNKMTKACVVVPEAYSENGKPFPVLYLLPGYGTDYASWVRYFPQIKEFSDNYNMIMIGVDGGLSSWYFDSPIDPKMKYETYITSELICFIDSSLNTVKDRSGRAITGLSMGGHGALYLAMRHQDIFGAAGSMSGGVDFRPFPDNWELSKTLGTKALYPENWNNNTVLSQLYLCRKDKLSIIIDCGVDDFFIEANRKLHENMLYLNIDHDYIERPGKHNGQYWANSFQYQLLFFHNYFMNYSSNE